MSIDAQTLNEEELAAAYKEIDYIREWCKAVEEEVKQRLERGEKVPGYKLVAGRKGNRAWTDANEVENKAKELKCRGSMFKEVILSPAQAEKTFKKSPHTWEELSKFITRADGKPVVAEESDTRPAIKDLKEEFKEV